MIRLKGAIGIITLIITALLIILFIIEWVASAKEIATRTCITCSGHMYYARETLSRGTTMYRYECENDPRHYAVTHYYDGE